MIEPNTALVRALLESPEMRGRLDLLSIHPSGAVASRTFDSTDRVGIDSWCRQHVHDYNLYFTVNEGRDNAEPDKKLLKADIARLRAVFVDLDPGTSLFANGDPDGGILVRERARLLDTVREATKGDCPPSIVIDSGGGYQALWFFDAPLPATPENVRVVEGIGRTLQARYGGDSVFNIDRVLRLPGTVNLPNAKKVLRGRRPSLTSVLLSPLSSGDRYTLEALAAWAPPSAERTTAKKRPDFKVNMALVEAATSIDELPTDLQQKFDAACAEHNDLLAVWNGETQRGQTDTTRSEWIFWLARRLHETGSFNIDEFGQLAAAWHLAYGPETTERHIVRAWGNTGGARVQTAVGFSDVTLQANASTAGWSQPIDPWRQTASAPEIDLSLFPPAFTRWVQDIAARTGTMDGAVATAGLCMCSIAISSEWRVQVKQRNTRHLVTSVMWGVVSGRAGSHKSSLLREATEPLAEIEKEWARQNEIERKRHAASVSQYKQRVKAGDQTASEPEPPRARRKILQNTTTEKAGLIAKDNPGLLIHYDELSGWFASMDAYRSGGGSGSVDAPFYLTGRDGGSYSFDRISRESIHIPVLSLGILGGIQPEVLTGLMKTWSSNGMLQRFALVNMPTAKVGEDREPDEHASSVISEAVRCIVDQGDGPTFNGPPRFRFAPEAERFRQEVVDFARNVVANPEIPAPVQGWADKAEDLWARVAFTLHVVEHATNHAEAALLLGDDAPNSDVFHENRPSLQIPARTAEAATRYVIDFLYQHQLYFYRVVAGMSVDEDEAARRVASFILRNSLKTIDDRTLQTSITRMRGPTAEARQRRSATMTSLDLDGWVRPIGHNTTTGRPTRWAVNPLVHDGRFAAITGAEAARCSAVSELIAKAAVERREERQTPLEELLG